MRLPSARTAARLTAPVSTACASAFQDSRTMPAPCASDCSGNDFCYDASCHCHPGRRLLPPLVPSGVQGMWKAGKCACAATDLRATTARATARASPSSANAPRASPTSSARRLACPHDCTNHGICYNNGTLRVLLRGRLAAVTAVAVTAAMARVGSAKASATAAASTASAGAAGWVGLAGVAAQAG